MANPGGANDTKHCFTSGLVEQLKARSSVARPSSSSTLFIFIWESPPLAQIYKITFLVRVEANGQEALGFRFDDVTAETPREIAWGGMVGTSHSPRCFLDGSQTFLTDSISKPSERCRRGWHVRLGEVSQILNMLATTQDSLAMKLSLRTLDSNTRVTNLVFRSNNSSALERFYQDTLQYERPKSNTTPPNSLLTIRPNHQLFTSSGPSIRHTRQPKLVTSSTPLSRSSPIPTSRQIAQNIQNYQKHATPAFSLPLNTASPPRIKSHRNIPLPIPSVPMTPSISSSTQTSPLSHPSPLTPPFSRCKSALQDTSTFHHADSLASITPPSDQSQASVTNDSLDLAAVTKGSSLEADPSLLPIPTSENIAASTDNNTVDLIDDSQEINQDSQDTIQVSKDTIIKDLPDNMREDSLAGTPSSPVEMVCFVFPPNTKRFKERKLYIPYHDLIKLDYFQNAFQSSKSTLSIDESARKSFPSFKVVTNRLMCITKKALQLSCSLLPSSPTISKYTIRNEDAKFKILFFVCKISLGLAELCWKTALEAIGMILQELCLVLNDVAPEDSTNTQQAQTTTTLTSTLLYLRSGLKTFCQTGLLLQQYLIGTNCFDDDDSDDELESLLDEDSSVVQPTPINLKATFVIHHIGYASLCALSDFLQYGAINFAPLRSSFEVQKELANELSKDGSNHGIGRDFPTELGQYIASRSTRVIKDGGIISSEPSVKLTACSPKSVYVLADRLGLLHLKQLAHRQIVLGLSPLNILRELRNPSVFIYKELLLNTAKSLL